jgi:hypothetical protein
MTDGPNLEATLELLEAEARRRENEKIAAGEAIRIPLDPVVARPGEDNDTAIASLKAREIEKMRANGETREIIFEPPEFSVILTGVPRDGEFGNWKCERFEPEYPSASRYAATTIPSTPTTAPKPSEPADWTRITVTLSPPDERSTGVVAEGKFAILNGEVHVHALWGKPLGSISFAPGDDTKAIARRLLRDKTAKKWAGFYAPIRRVH